MEITRYGINFYEFSNGLVAYTGDPSSDDPLVRDPFCWLDMDETRSYIGMLPEREPDLDMDRLKIALDWLDENYSNLDDWDRDAAIRLDEVVDALL